ncbi:thiolase C-terminal domain-containing protein [Gordonia sp. KTR9]|uniref:thiolase C-terminal domain-containing protein n=1 Tax=Gordonia sp. KTR9 TaxID=337191 RepID=UPI00027DE956|nr:OB-fold domain-containing protein [Gordonia sp. KTR9]AFR49415.1 Acetyl-CoA acetyltransferase [Gordonia sp. KTR9]
MDNNEPSRAESSRPLPQPTLSSAQFWASGADEVLRVAKCEDCGAWSHPMPTMCRVCRSRDLRMTQTSGRGTVVGFTVNSQQWLPDLPPPYVVAIVALAEDDGARLTTNIVNCDPGDVRVGLRVRVLFERAIDGIWLPLFEPDPEFPDVDGPLPEPVDYSGLVRPMASSTKFEDRVAITGVGQSKVGRRLMVDPLSLTVDACLQAVADAGLELEDIDGLSTYPGAHQGGISEGGIMPVEQALNLRPTWINGGGDTPGQNGSIVAAMLAVASGLCRHVLCFRTVWESTHSTLVRAGTWHEGGGRATGMTEFRAPFGAMSAANWIAMQASHYFHRYGTDRETLGAIAVNARTNAVANPEAVYRDPITMDDYLGARMVSSPFGLYDCDVPVDGAVAVIVSAKETVADLDCVPVFIEAVGTQILEPLSWDQGTLTHMPQSLGPAAHLWSRTHLRPADVDVAELYDGFTFNALSWLEGLGFCEIGGAQEFIDGGRGISIDGRLPVNTHGGQLSAGRTHGYGFFREAVLQLRGEAPGRQVPNAKVAVVTAGGGVPAGAVLLRNE